MDIETVIFLVIVFASFVGVGFHIFYRFIKAKRMFEGEKSSLCNGSHSQDGCSTCLKNKSE